MEANRNLSGIQFQYHPPSMIENYHRVTADLSGTDIAKSYSELGQTVRPAEMSWTAKGIRAINVPAAFKRQGIGTELWNQGHQAASANAGVPKPKHSADRTNEGDAWARSVGGRLPRRLQ